MTVKEEVGIQAAGYIRVSRNRAAQNGYGLAAQETDLRRYADFRNIEIVEMYSEPGESGYERERPALERLLQDAKQGKFKVVIFPSIDRSGRSVRDIIEIDEYLRKLGIDIIFVREGIDTSTPIGEFFRNVMASFAQLEGRIIYERLANGKLEKAAAGGYTGGWIAYGYKWDNGDVVVVKKEAAVVRRIFKWRAEGKSLRGIIRMLDEGNAATQRGGKWAVSTLRKILSNPFYTGRIVFEGKLIPGQHDAIIPDELFTAVNKENIWDLK